jgi:hypothetical protein
MMIAITVFSFPSRLVIEGCATNMRPKCVAERVVIYLETQNLSQVRVTIHLLDTEVIKQDIYVIILRHRIKYVADTTLLNYLD